MKIINRIIYRFGLLKPKRIEWETPDATLHMQLHNNLFRRTKEMNITLSRLEHELKMVGDEPILKFDDSIDREAVKDAIMNRYMKQLRPMKDAHKVQRELILPLCNKYMLN